MRFRKLNPRTIRSQRELKRLGLGREAVAFMRRFSTLADAWNACQRGDWMMCLMVQGKILNQATSLKLAVAFAKRSPTRSCRLWIGKVAGAQSDPDAAAEAWAASYASSFVAAYRRTRDFDRAAFLVEMRWQSGKIRQIAGNPFRE